MQHEPLARYVPEQIALYQTDHLLTHEVCRFDPARAAAELQVEREVMAIDIGGDKIRSAIYRTGDGTLTKLDERVFRSRKGTGYLPFLERLVAEATERDLRVGIASATKMEGSRITRTVNLPVFFEEMRRAHGGDYARLFPGRVFAANDTIMGICGASTLLCLQGIATSHVAFIICASGVGASVIADGMAIHVEAAHVPIVPSLNPLGQATPCGVEGRSFVCVERVAAARAGIEDIYRQQTGEARDGVALGKLYEAGDDLATILYETSATALAHAIAGVMRRYAFPEGEESVVVLHGGNFEVPRYREAIQTHLSDIPGAGCRPVFSRDLSPNLCLDGAAITAITLG
jgi:predicted NBD/HSP70 family sugar kinase